MKPFLVILALALLTGCSAAWDKFFGKGYRICGGAGGAYMCIDRPNPDNTETNR